MGKNLIIVPLRILFAVNLKYLSSLKISIYCCVELFM